VETVGGNWGAIVVLLVAVLLSGMLHSLAYFELMGSVGAVSTGILQSLRLRLCLCCFLINKRAVSVFVISALLFCDRHSVQCFNEYKGMSMVFVVIGVLYFSNISARINSKL
jgi:hypothetical protein